MSMTCVDKEKLNQLLLSRGISLAQLAKGAGISRQSLYDMFRGQSIFTRPFEKIVHELGVDFSELLAQSSRLDGILGDAPDAVRRAALELQRYAERKKATLFLIGSRARGKKDFRADWDFGIYFRGKLPTDFARIKQRLKDRAFPHRLDIVDLSSAPPWFLPSVAEDALHMTGAATHDEVFDTNDRRSA